MATTVPTERKGSAAGWSMAGNLGGTGIGGALGLWLTENTSKTVTAVVLAVVMALCGLFVWPIEEPPRIAKPALKAIADLGRDLYRTAKSREGWTGLIICLSPVGAGAAANLFSGAMHNDYGASEHRVEVVTGVLGGIVSAIGCLVGGVLADKMNRRLAYGLAGGLMAIVALVMAFSPTDPTTFTVGTLSYQFVNGIGYAAFVAFVLEMIGHEGAVATKYTLFVAASNWAISYTSILDGWGYDKGKVRGLFLADFGATVAGILILLVMLGILRRGKTKAAPAPAG
jgi:PAT family beta-lactamase induction signal transducer AmpG